MFHNISPVILHIGKKINFLIIDQCFGAFVEADGMKVKLYKPFSLEKTYLN